jgi:hypothetical protein
MDLFYASTLIVVGNGKNTPFWDAPWLNRSKPRDIAGLALSYSRCPRGKSGVSTRL